MGSSSLSPYRCPGSVSWIVAWCTSTDSKSAAFCTMVRTSVGCNVASWAQPWRLSGVASRADDRRLSLWFWWRYSAKKSVYDWRKSMYHWITLYIYIYIYTVGDISQPWNVCASWGSMLPYDYLVVATGGSSYGIIALQVAYMRYIPSGNLLHSYWKSLFFMGKSTISMGKSTISMVICYIAIENMAHRFIDCEIDCLPIEHGDFPVRYVKLLEGTDMMGLSENRKFLGDTGIPQFFMGEWWCFSSNVGPVSIFRHTHMLPTWVLKSAGFILSSADFCPKSIAGSLVDV